MTKAVLECRSLYKEFSIGSETIGVLKDINLRIDEGESVAIIGTSGAGKTTLLTMLGGLDTPTNGEVLLLGENISVIPENQRTRLRSDKLGFVYQFHHLLQEFTALENVQIPLMMNRIALPECKQRATEMLRRVGLKHRLEHKPAELSGGERQRVAIARALVNHPACVLLDEPTGNLDQANSELVYELLHQLNQELAISFVLVTHDLKMAKKIRRKVTLESGVIHE